MKYSDFPPCDLFIAILENAPKAAHFYLKLWAWKDAKNYVKIEKREVRHEFLLSPTLFRNYCVELMILKKIDFSENKDQFQVKILT